MRILGLDPGYGIVGFGVVEKTGNRITHVAHGAITTAKGENFERRLGAIYDNLKRLLETYNPNLVAVESIYFYRNAKTAILVGEARGVILLAVEQAGLPIVEFTPYQVKQAVTGFGKADKLQIQRVVRLLLNLNEEPRPDDAADALAIAWCAAVSSSKVTRGNGV